jgi:hypothetical protein
MIAISKYSPATPNMTIPKGFRRFVVRGAVPDPHAVQNLAPSFIAPPQLPQKGIGFSSRGIDDLAQSLLKKCASWLRDQITESGLLNLPLPVLLPCPIIRNVDV